MGYAQRVDTDELSLPSDPQWKVFVKQEASWEDQQRAENALVYTSGNTQAVNPEDITAFVRARTLVMITNWTLTDEFDKPLPVDEHGYARLNKQDGAFLVTETRKRYEGRSAKDEAPFGKPSGPRSKATKSVTAPPSLA